MMCRTHIPRSDGDCSDFVPGISSKERRKLVLWGCSVTVTRSDSDTLAMSIEINFQRTPV